MARWKLLVGSKSFGKAFPEHLRQLEEAGCEVIPNQVGRPYTAAELGEALRGVDAIVTGTDELTAQVIASTDRLKTIAKHGVGLDNIDLQAARSRGIVVSAAFGAVHDSVADLTLALLLAVARGIVPSHLSTRAGRWKGFMGVELRGKTLGIVGLGRIGKEVALRAEAFGMRIVATDPYQDPAFSGAHQVRYLSLPELLAASDVVSLHAGLEQAGRPLLGAAELAMMRRGAILVNTGRGHLVDEGALADALREGKLLGAGLDVFREEPPRGSPLLGLENVVLAPHMAGDTGEARRRMGEITVENVVRVMRGERPLSPVE
ncbi:MAG TPA: phosphoglycerate dehydrogenase [Anaeromyxobacter sp.]|nr:phosphoglycerate dehydrogenase [Anaeromyxobacter sp.]